MGGPYDLSVSPSPFGLDFGTLHLTILAWFGLIKLWLCLFYRILAFLNTKVSSIVKSTVFAVKAMLPGRAGPCVSVTTHPHLLSWGLSSGGERHEKCSHKPEIQSGLMIYIDQPGLRSRSNLKSQRTIAQI